MREPLALGQKALVVCLPGAFPSKGQLLVVAQGLGVGRILPTSARMPRGVLQPSQRGGGGHSPARLRGRRGGSKGHREPGRPDCRCSQGDSGMRPNRL